MNNLQPVSPRDTLDILFAHRNRAYGAYQLRREYPATLLKAWGIGMLVIILAFLIPRILSSFSGLLPLEEKKNVVYETREIKIEEPAVPPPVVTPPPKPPQPSIALTPPMVAPDDEVPVEQQQTDVQTLIDDPRNIGSKTVEGDPGDAPPELNPSGSGLNAIETPKPPDDDEPVEPFVVQKMPLFPGGEAAMYKWIISHFNYPEMARDGGVQGSVVLTFVVDKNGGITDVKVVKTPASGASLGREAIRVVSAMPAWSPGEVNGRAVKVRYTLPIKIELN